MRWPTLSVQQESVEQVDVFGGYNHNLRIGDGEFYDMENLTSDQYPQMASRAPRGVYIEKQVDGMIEKDSLCYVSGGNFYINNKAIVERTMCGTGTSITPPARIRSAANAATP